MKLSPRQAIRNLTALDQAAELAKLREHLEAKEKEANENYDRYLRQVAEVENFRKRANREKG